MGSVKSFTNWGVPVLAMALAVVPIAQLYAQAAAPTAAPAGDAVKGKAVFENSVCGACHTLAAADASGPIGPSLDQNAKLTHTFITGVVTNGSGAMPPFAGQLTEDEINDVAAYILSASAK